MPDDIHQFSVTYQEDQFLFGCLDEQPQSGVFLATEYLLTLANVLAAAKIRLGSLQGTPLPDAITGLVGMLEELFSAHDKLLAQEALDYERVRRELKEAVDKLSGGDDGPKRA